MADTDSKWMLRLTDILGVEASSPVLTGASFSRSRCEPADGIEVLRDSFLGLAATCHFIRCSGLPESGLSLRVDGEYQFESVAAGGWLLRPRESGGDHYWLPSPPKLRTLDTDGHILSVSDAEVLGLDMSSSGIEAVFRLQEGYVLDLVFWRINGEQSDFTCFLSTPNALDLQDYFVYASHTRITRPADFFHHLVHGRVYGNIDTWPKNWRLCDELDALGLFLIANGLFKASAQPFYQAMTRQLVLSVIDRQAPDGGWYHGEWTDYMESHYRLVNGALSLLANYLEEHEDPLVRNAADKAADFLVQRTQSTDMGLWFMHDSLESSENSIAGYPFPTVSSTTLGKSPSNMLVLNTHLDSIVALDRYAQVTKDSRFTDAIASACEAAIATMNLNTAETLYRWLFRIFDLTFLPKKQAERLPLPLRAIKRIGWKYIAPNLHKIKARYPRLVMPNGYIDRELCQKGLSPRYQSVNVWDLVRYLRRFPDPSLQAILQKSLDYTQHGPIRAHWKESPKRQDSLAFWVEALYQFCLGNDDQRYRQWLADAILDSQDVSIGLPPSVLGANYEAIEFAGVHPTPSLIDPRLRIVNLWHGKTAELMIVNPTDQTIELTWKDKLFHSMQWRTADASGACRTDTFSLPARGWVQCLAMD